MPQGFCKDLPGSCSYPNGGGAPGEIRTHDLCLRRAALYPAELRVPRMVSYDLSMVKYSRYAASARSSQLAASRSIDEPSRRFTL